MAHSGDGFAQLRAWLAGHGVVPALAAVAIEIPRGAVVETLIEQGYTVFALNPKQLDRFRDRYTSAGAKDDSRDAWVAASALRTDAAAFHRLRLDPPELIHLRELSRTADELRGEVQRLANRLREQIQRYDPRRLFLSPAADRPLLWDLLELAPLPGDADRLTLAQVAALLDRHHIRRWRAEPVLERLRAAPLPVAPGVAEAASERALGLVKQLRLAYQLRAENHKRLVRLLQQMSRARSQSGSLSDAAIVDSLPSAGVLITAALLTESSYALAKRDAQALRSYSGVAPVTRRSGKRCSVSMRYACNPRLRDAFYHHALGTLHTDPIARRHYHQLRAAGHSHARALRGVEDRWVTVLMAMLRAGQLYDPTRRKAWRATDAGVQAPTV